jgi:hypothetical protein
MDLEFVPLLPLQRELHGIPRGMDRFRQYLRVMLNDERDDVRLPPLGIMNPMGKGHVTAALDALLALDVDGVGARAVAEASAHLADVPGDYKVALVVADDAGGGWTNRYDWEFTLRFENRAMLKRGWLSGILWTSEPAAAEDAREAVRTAVYRAAYLHEHGTARTLRQRLAQEGHVLARADCRRPTLDADDLAYTREVLAPHLDADDRRTNIECLFGDAAARSLGFTPRGLSESAGLALALDDARSLPRRPSR